MISMQKRIFLVLIFAVAIVLYKCWELDRYYFIQSYFRIVLMKNNSGTKVSDLASPGKKPGIMFVESTDNVEPTPLVVCSVESAALRNPDKPIYYFMKGFSGNLNQYPQSEYKVIPLLSSVRNVTILPLNLAELFEGTPLKGWYQKVKPEKERHWTYLLADGCRLALLWKYRGIYLDTDIISLRSMPFANFTCPESTETVNNAALGFHYKHHTFLWNCMEDFVAHYNGDIWGQQGPRLITRVLKKWCNTSKLATFIGKECNGISIWITNRFYPVPYLAWGSYYVHWEKGNIERAFSASYGAHIWNYMNFRKKANTVAGSGSLIEQFFQLHCPITYKKLIQSRNSTASVQT
ncbi:alpha-1,4-N-acetylglucosaminyltransferase-like [Hypanus sabinus]|uniref:alpha-1,4-N-acetylglucosaminyltransferase-like n=1 Tax=Hypanus sabinus TaxID=79690 RepID=UPI0028C43C3E|nr:alpha-1,4-N-acetylglucosaminyltransferase-like [Hypanus sabinus]